MANVPQNQQIVPEEFASEDQDMVSRIADPFNTYVEQLNGILDRNLTFADNLRCDLRTLQVVGGQPLTFRYSQTDKPVGLWVVGYSNLTNPAESLSTAVQAQWTYDGRGNISVTKLTGLTTGNNYSVTLIAISG